MIAALVGSGLGLGLGAAGFAVYYPNATLFGPVVGRGPRRPELYLTFDDGPNPRATPAILDTLAEFGVPAAFFLVGDFVRRHPAIARRTAESGHTLGNHTTTHAKLHGLGPGRIAAELGRAHDLIAQATGRPPRAFRAPHGSRNPFVARAARRLGYRTFGWTFGVWDSDPIGPGEIRRRIRRRLRPGAIILLHDGDGYDPDGDRSATALALPDVIRDAHHAGYRFRSLGALLE